VRSALEWAQVRALVADGVSQREIAQLLGINRRTGRGLDHAPRRGGGRYERSYEQGVWLPPPLPRPHSPWSAITTSLGVPVKRSASGSYSFSLAGTSV
jgi:hypothetical protein